ncbi:peptidase inhibitor family I36 protein [Streptomyces griseoaurantiacus]|uniref:peptidase inhibitor family I36 protein n=1 Tax=Streptomyces griseoaurantiacus TaxID=68213 RepID=UPI003460E2E0
MPAVPIAKLCRTALASVAAFVLIPLSATDSAAVTCSPDHFCLWEGESPQGTMGSFVTGTDDTGRVGLTAGGATARNRTTQDWCLWSETDYGGRKTVVKPGQWLRLPFRAHSLLPENTWRCVT